MTDRNAGAAASGARGTLSVLAKKMFTRTMLVKAAALAAAFAMAPIALTHAAPRRPAARKPAAQHPQQQELHLIYAPTWTKLCRKEGCDVLEVAFNEVGFRVAVAELVEPGGKAEFLQVTLPLVGLQLGPGTRVKIDQHTAMAAPFITCLPSGCIARYKVTPEMIAAMKKGKILYTQALVGPGKLFGEPQLGVPLSLTDFAKALDGPPTDPKVFQAHMEKQMKIFQARQEKLEKQQVKQHELQQELEKRAEQARKQFQARHTAPSHNRR